MSAAAKRCADAIRRVGGDAWIVRGGAGIPFPASIQPRLSGGEAEASPLGLGAEEHFTLYAPLGTAADDLQPGDTVVFRESRYRVRRVETLHLSGAPLYHWAVLRRESGGE